MKKTLSFVLVIAMLLTAMLGLTVYAAEEIDEIPELAITSARLEFGDRVYLLVAVKADSAEGLTLTITNSKNTEKPVTVITEPMVGGDVPEGCIAFRYEDLGAKNMGDELILQASVGETKSAIKTYSVLEYALKAENEGKQSLSSLASAMINYGAKAQEAFGHTGDYALADKDGKLIDYSLVVLPDGATFADGSNKAIMKSGDAPLTATLSGATSNDVWVNSAVQQFGSGSTATISYRPENQRLYIVPKSVFGTSQHYYIDMDTYTGGEITATSGNSTSVKLGDQNISFGHIINANASVVIRPGHIELNGNTSLKSINNTGFQAAVKQACGADGNGIFTVSLTVAGDSNLTNPTFSGYNFRSGAQKMYTTAEAKTEVSGTAYVFGSKYYDADGKLLEYSTFGRIRLLGNNDKTTGVYSYVREDGKAAGQKLLSDLSATMYSDIGTFVTVHVVFDFSGNADCPTCKNDATAKTTCGVCNKTGKTYTVSYYVGNSTVPVQVHKSNVSPSFMQAAYIEHMGLENAKSYFKAAVVTQGNITNYFK